jgi:microcystin-dependent protein
MSDPFIGEIKLISFNFPPRGWAFCNGQTLPINQNQALFSILGTTYGGDGQVNFGLPNLQGRTPVHIGNGISLGQRGGETAHTLNVAELPAHNHIPVGSSQVASAGSPAGGLWAKAASSNFGATPNAAMSGTTITASGGSQPHENMPPYLVLNFVIALQGIFPSQN